MIRENVRKGKSAYAVDSVNLL